MVCWKERVKAAAPWKIDLRTAAAAELQKTVARSFCLCFSSSSSSRLEGLKLVSQGTQD